MSLSHFNHFQYIVHLLIFDSWTCWHMQAGSDKKYQHGASMSYKTWTHGVDISWHFLLVSGSSASPNSLAVTPSRGNLGVANNLEQNWAKKLKGNLPGVRLHASQQSRPEREEKLLLFEHSSRNQGVNIYLAYQSCAGCPAVSVCFSTGKFTFACISLDWDVMRVSANFERHIKTDLMIYIYIYMCLFVYLFIYCFPMFKQHQAQGRLRSRLTDGIPYKNWLSSVNQLATKPIFLTK